MSGLQAGSSAHLRLTGSAGSSQLLGMSDAGGGPPSLVGLTVLRVR